LLENENPQTLAEAIKKVLRHPDEYKIMQKSALETASHFTLENWRDTIKQHLDKAWKIQN